MDTIDGESVEFLDEGGGSLPGDGGEKDTWKILIVDDDRDVHNVTSMALSGVRFEDKGLNLLSAYSGAEARTIISANPDTAVILLDIVMESEEEGFKLIRYIRNELNFELVRIILRTGQPGFAPERDVILHYDINDYKEKNELTSQKLFTSIVASLRSYRDLMELQGLKNNLEAMVKKRTEELESTNQELKDFAYIVSHDLKAPLRAIDSLANWIVADYADKIDDDGKAQMTLLLSRVKRMRDLIDGVLQYSRVGRISEEKVVVPLDMVLSELIDMLAPPPNMSITVQSDLPSILFEPTRISQVFQNLISNALKYIDKPEGVIRVAYQKDHGYCRFSVSDNGPGIEQKDFERIFLIFQTLVSKDKFESTGVGLSLVKKIVETNGGSVWLESKVGTGSTFYFTLPESVLAV